jgi:SAM-dependent methyltransferase
VHVVLEGDATPPPGGAVQVVLGTGETAAGGWGDGAHPSTALCLEWLSERGFKEDEAFLDYGCGSGVLAIAARKLGCREAVGVDVEYEALESAAENAERNGVDVDWVHGRSIIPGNDEYDAVVANILVFRGASRITTCTPSTRRLLDGVAVQSPARHRRDGCLTACAPDLRVDLRTGRPALPAVDGRYSSSRDEGRRRALPVWY